MKVDKGKMVVQEPRRGAFASLWNNALHHIKTNSIFAILRDWKKREAGQIGPALDSAMSVSFNVGDQPNCSVDYTGLKSIVC